MIFIKNHDMIEWRKNEKMGSTGPNDLDLMVNYFKGKFHLLATCHSFLYYFYRKNSTEFFFIFYFRYLNFVANELV